MVWQVCKLSDIVREDISIKEIEILTQRYRAAIASKLKKGGRRKAVYNKDSALEKILEIQGKEGEESGIIGILADIGKVEDEVLDKTLATLCGERAMKIVVVKTNETLHRLKKLFEKSSHQVALLSLEVMERSKKLDENGKLVLPDIGDAEGFVGYESLKKLTR